MALRKPIVLVSGELQQIQAGDTLDAVVAETEQQIYTNADASGHVLGDVVYLFGADSVKKATANAAGTKEAIALATASISNGVAGAYQNSGTLAGLAGLTPGSVYYLSPTTAGGMTPTPPSTVGQYVTRLGVATSATELFIRIERPILL